MQQNETMMRSFEYRQPRVTAHFNLQFQVEGRLVRGMCTDVSDGGIRATFEEPVLVGSVGSLLLRHPKRQFTLEAVVAHLEGDHVGLTFLCHTAEERLLSEQFAALAGGPRNSW